MSGIALPTGSSYSSHNVDLSALWVNVADGVGDAAAQWDQGKLPYLHMMFHPDRQPGCTMEKIYFGVYDAEIRAWLEKIKAYELTGRRAVIVPYPEMNGNWTCYGVDMDDPQPGQFISAYNYIVWLGRQLGIESDWCWAPNNRGVGNLHHWWPNPEYVDVVGMSAYNMASLTGAPWRSAAETIGPYVDEVKRFTQKPVVITQVGAPMGDDRTPGWLSDVVSLNRHGVIDDYIWFGIDAWAYPDVADFNARIAEGPSFCGQ